jgi:mRNA-degrading endonuclease RelE of RelBE toxin-antitoxin system
LETMRLRIGDYRVVYVVQDGLVLVTVIRTAHVGRRTAT